LIDLQLLFLDDIHIDNETVDDVYDTRGFRKEKIFLGKATKIIDENSLELFDGKILVILPWVEYKKVLEVLSEKGVKPMSIVCWNEFFI